MKQSGKRTGLLFHANRLADARNDCARIYPEIYWKLSLKCPKLFSPPRVIVYQCEARDAVYKAEAGTHFPGYAALL